MSSIKLKFKAVGTENNGSLYFQITHKRVVKQVRTSYHIHVFEWDNTNKCIAAPPSTSVSRKNELSLIKDKIQWEYSKLKEALKFLENRNEPFTTKDIVLRYKAALANKMTVFDFFDKQIFRLNKLGKKRTAECYKACASSFKKFRRGTDLYFDMIDADTIELYEAYLRQHNLCRNTTSFYLRNLRSIYNKAVKEGFAMNSSLFCNVYTGVDKTTKRAISLQEIKRLKHIDLSDNKSLDFVRDIFMFSFYTRGMSFIDIAYLRKRDVINGYLTYCRKKTGQQLTIKWKKEMSEIVNKYNNPDTQYLLPIICVEDGTERQQYLNKMLIINRRLKLLAKKANIHTPLTMYVARHSWASIARDSNVPTGIISMGMGHDSETTTEIYLHSIQNSRVDEANDKILRNL